MVSLEAGMKYYSLLIVEDEDNTREGLANYIDWTELGFHLVAALRNGREAILYLEAHPEETSVILSDIRMDDVSGLELAQYVYEHQLNVLVILLTAYRDFEYARMAISYRVMEYLLKPVKIQELKKVFKNIKDKLDAIETEEPKETEPEEIDLTEKAKEYINQHYSSKACSLEAVASYVGVVPSHLSKLFRLKTGETFTDYITCVRIEAAKNLLLHTNQKVREISEQLGYGSSRHFSKVFRNATGLLPKEFRNRGERKE